MVGSVFLPALAALMVQGNHLALAGSIPAAALASDSATLADAITGRRLDFALRGSGSAIQARARPTERGCATLSATGAPGASDARTRLLRWADVAWTGALPDGRVMVAFFEQEGRLPGDRLAFTPADPAAFRAALARVRENCRNSAAEYQRVLSGDYTGSRSCYFPRLPGLELVESTATAQRGEPTRAVVTLLAEETPEAELRLLAERDPDGEGWARPELAFTVADARLKSYKIGAVHFALDGAPVDARHSIAIYNETRLRIRMDPSASGAPAENADSFYRRLAASGRVTIKLNDSAGATRAVLNFDAGSMLAGARRALDTAGWSCAAAAPMPAPAAQWQLTA